METGQHESQEKDSPTPTIKSPGILKSPEAQNNLNQKQTKTGKKDKIKCHS